MSGNKCIDTLRGIACILVLFIHYPFPGLFGEIVKSIARGAVPFFFIVSGYFYGMHRSENYSQYGIKTIKNNGILLFYGFFFSEFFLIVKNKSLFRVLKQQVNWDNLIKLIIFNDTGEIYHLWFLLALMYCFFIWIIIDSGNCQDSCQ